MGIFHVFLIIQMVPNRATSQMQKSRTMRVTGMDPRSKVSHMSKVI